MPGHHAGQPESRRDGMGGGEQLCRAGNAAGEEAVLGEPQGCTLCQSFRRGEAAEDDPTRPLLLFITSTLLASQVIGLRSN